MTKISTLLPTLLLVACSGTDPVDPPDPPIEGDCPASTGLTVCDLKADGERQPALGDPVSLTGLVVTTPTVALSFDMEGNARLGGFFVQDQMTNDDLDGAYSGIVVSYVIADTPTTPAVGAVIDVEGTFDQFARDGATPQLQVNAGFIEDSGQTATVRTVLITNPSDLVSAYEGSIVQLNSVSTLRVNPPGAGGNNIFGFEVTGNIIVSTTLLDSPYFSRAGEEFTSVTGVYRLGTFNYDSGIYTLSPRTRDDIVAADPISVVRSIAAVQDPNSPDKPADACDSSQDTADRRCPKIELADVVVTAVGGYVSSNLRAVWVQDDTVIDGRFAGIKVVYNRDNVNYLPEVGERVQVDGEVINWFNGLQVQFARFTSNNMSSPIDPVVVPAADIARGSDPSTNAYEGVLVQLENATVTQACIEDDQFRDFGNFLVDGVFIGTAFFFDYTGDLRPSSVNCDMMADGPCSCAANSRPNDMRALNDTFASIAGVIDYSFNEFRLNPRDNDDLVQ